MTIDLKIPTGAIANYFTTAAQASLLQLRPDSDSSILELAPSQSFSDDFTDNPFSELKVRFIPTDWRTGAIVLHLQHSSGNYVKGQANTTSDTKNKHHFVYYKYPQCYDCKIHAELRVSTLYNRNFPGVCARTTETSGYFVYIYDINSKIYLSKRTNGIVSANLDKDAIAYADNDWIHVKFWLAGSTLKAKHWKDGTAEPMVGGPDGDGYQMKAIDSDIEYGLCGFILGGTYSALSYVRNFQVTAMAPASTSPVAYTYFDTGQDDSVIANGATAVIKSNTGQWDSGTVNVKIGASNTLYDGTGGDSDCTAIDALLNGSWLTPDANDEITIPSELTGRYIYFVYQFVSDGTQQASLTAYDEGVTVSLASGAGGAGAFYSGVWR